MTYPTARPAWPSGTGMAEVSASMAQLLSDEPDAMAAVFGDRGVLPTWTIVNGHWVRELRIVVLDDDGKIIREVSK